MTTTNIKNLPAGEYFTEQGYSQSYPWAVVKRTAKTATLARVVVRADPEWEPEFAIGGFFAHCTNQGDQTWYFDKVDTAYTKTVRLTKKGWSYRGTRFYEGRAFNTHDYNF